MMCANGPIHYDLMVVFICLHIALPHYDLSEGIELLKCLSGTFCLKCVSKINWNLSIIFHEICGAVCIQFTHFSYDNCENICTLSYYHHQIGSMTHLPLFRVRSRNNGICCMSFNILVKWVWLWHSSSTHHHHISVQIHSWEFRCCKDMYLVYLSFIKLNSPWNKMMVTQQLITSQVFSWEHFCIGF